MNVTSHIPKPFESRDLCRLALLCIVLVGAFLLSTVSAFAGDAPKATFFNAFLRQESVALEFGLVWAEGLETQWRIEYSADKATLEKGTWEKPEGSTVPGCSGTITEAEADVNVSSYVKAFCSHPGEATGLSPGTTYYFRLVAKSVVGEGSLVEEFTTSPQHPVIEGSEVSVVTEGSAEVNGFLIPENHETLWRFEYSTDKEALEKGEGAVGPSGKITEADENFHQVAGKLEGLKEGTSYYLRLHAENGHEPAQNSEPRGFETGGPPVVTTFAVHGIDVEGEAMRALGSVEPHGGEADYYVEYLPQAKFEAEGWSGALRTSPVDAGVGAYENGAWPVQLVGVDISGLQAGVGYRYRLVATSSGNPVVYGGEQTLKMPVVGSSEEAAPASCPNESLRVGPSAALPDCRAYEQVTPAEKGGAQDVFKYGERQEGALVGEDGEHVMLHAPGVEWGANPDGRLADYFFTRTSTGWQMTSDRPPGETGADSFTPFLFNSDLTDVGLAADWDTSGASSSKSVEFDAGPPGGPYVDVASIPRSSLGIGGDALRWVAASADFSKLILRSEDHTLLGRATGTTTGNDLYEFAGGELREVNVGTGTCGARMVDGFEGYQGLLGEKRGTPQSNSSAHAVSADGSHVFFEAVPAGECSKPSQLFMRVDGKQTISIGEYVFLAANEDGSKLLLEKQNGETHEYLLYETATKKARSLFSTQQAIFGSSAGQAGSAVVSSDLTAIYFFSQVALTPEAPPPTEGIGAQPENLYRFDIGSGTLRFIAQSGGNSGGGFTGHSASPDGRYFYWIAIQVGGVPGGVGLAAEQVYRYDNVEGIVQCMSCASSFDPRPAGKTTFSESGTTDVVDGTPGLSDASSDGDYVFFDTTAALVPTDVDGEVPVERGDEGEYASTSYSVSSDVYEWRKNGINGCAHLEGCVALISSGTGGLQNVLLGTTPSGRDVFFATHEALVGQDQDAAGDIYDARIDGGFPPPAAGPVECEGGSCQSSLAEPVDVTPGSSTFSGPGDLLQPPSSKPAAKPKRKTKKKTKQHKVKARKKTKKKPQRAKKSRGRSK